MFRSLRSALSEAYGALVRAGVKVCAEPLAVSLMVIARLAGSPLIAVSTAFWLSISAPRSCRRFSVRIALVMKRVDGLVNELLYPVKYTWAALNSLLVRPKKAPTLCASRNCSSSPSAGAAALSVRKRPLKTRSCPVPARTRGMMRTSSLAGIAILLSYLCVIIIYVFC